MMSDQIKNRFTTCQVLLAMMFIWLAWWPLALSVERHTLFYFMDSLIISMCIGVIVSFAPGIWKAMQGNPPYADEGVFLVIGIVSTCLGTFSRICFWFYARIKLVDLADELEHIWLAFFLWQIFVGYVVHFLCSRAIKGQIPTKSWMLTGALVSAGIALAFTTLYLVSGNPFYNYTHTRMGPV